jgi:hypothetical protein
LEVLERVGLEVGVFVGEEDVDGCHEHDGVEGAEEEGEST